MALTMFLDHTSVPNAALNVWVTDTIVLLCGLP